MNNIGVQSKRMNVILHTDFSGELISEMGEDKHFWIDIDKLKHISASENDFDKYYMMFF